MFSLLSFASPMPAVPTSQLVGIKCKDPDVSDTAYTPIVSMQGQVDRIKAMAKLAPITKPGVKMGEAHCSGSYVSDEGAILTAGHCLFINCDAPDDNGAIFCRININNVNSRVRILYQAQCADNDIQETMRLVKFKHPIPKNLLRCKDERGLLILLPDNPEKDRACMAISTGPVVKQAGNAIGWPAKTSRGEGDSNGKDLYVSENGAILDPRSYCVVKEKDPMLAIVSGVKGLYSKMMKKSDPRGEVIELPEEDQIAGPEFLQTTFDGDHGSSGGPLVSKETGEIIGVASRIAKAIVNVSNNYNVHNTFCEGATFFTPVSKSLPGESPPTEASPSRAKLAAVLESLHCSNPAK